MANRILLVDDEKVFLESLKDGLQTLSHIFETDICFSVSEALKLVLTRVYDIVITDIRMPQKSGIDLILQLKYIKYTGKVMVMSAYNTEASIKTIESLGVLEVISKPFKIDWLKNKLVSFFKNKVEDPVEFESISLLTVMQVINLEKKTTAVQIEMNSTYGIIYFINGEIINAEYRGLFGIEAIIELISLNKGKISIKKIKDRVVKKINIPFEKLIMEAVNVIDENRVKKVIHKKNDDLNFNENAKILLKDILSGLESLRGYAGSGVFSLQGGELLDDKMILPRIQLETFSTFIHNSWQNAQNLSDAISFGTAGIIQIETEKGILLAKSCEKDSQVVYTILILNNQADIIKATHKLREAVNDIQAVL